MKVFRLGQIGCGYWGKILYRYFGKHPGLRVTGMATRHPASLQGEFPPHVKLCTPAGLIEDPDIDAVVVATPLGDHYKYVLSALKRGKHIFCEKPLTLQGQTAEHLQREAASRGLHVFTDYIFTFSPAVRKMISLAMEGAIGRILGCSFHVRQLGHFANSVYWDLGSHILSIVGLLSPRGISRFHRHDVLVRDGVVESGQVSFWAEMPGGEEMRGNIALSFNHPIKERNMTLYGEKGTLTYDMMSRPPLVLAGYRVDRGHSRDAIDKQVTSFDFDEFNTVEEVVKGFYDVLAGDAPDNIDLSVGVTKAMERITSGTS